jgi:hypothetical protein
VLPAGSARLVRFQKSGFRPIERRLDAAADTTFAVRLDPEERPTPRRERDRARATRSAGGAADVSAAATIDPFGK